MANLFIANATSQNHQFLYRRPESSKMHSMHIRMGSQICIRDLDQAAIAAIVKQHEPYGMKSEDEAVKRPRFVGLCYAVDEPVKLARILERATMNTEAMMKRAAERREEVVGAIGANLANVQADAGMGVEGVRAEVELVDEKSGSIAQGFEVVPEGSAPRRNGAKSTARGRRSAAGA